MQKIYTPEEQALKPINLKLANHIIEALKMMEKNTKISVDDLTAKALLMFIATHNDYLGLRK
jgi:hypothetical protein